MKKENQKIGLTTEQSRKLIELSEKCLKMLIPGESVVDEYFKRNLGLYLSALAIDAENENKKYNLKKMINIRRNAIKAFNDYLGYSPTADDLPNHLLTSGAS